MKCDYPGCTGSHTSNGWRNMCPAARERKRFRQAQWARNKYWADPQWANEKRWTNWCYKGTAAGIISAFRSASRAKLAALEAIASEVNLMCKPQPLTKGRLPQKGGPPGSGNLESPMLFPSLTNGLQKLSDTRLEVSNERTGKNA